MIKAWGFSKSSLKMKMLHGSIWRNCFGRMVRFARIVE